MADIDLLRSQKNQILQLIKEAELDPFNFEWGVYPSLSMVKTTVTQLKYKGTMFHFVFDMQQGAHTAYYSPGKDKQTERTYTGSWNEQLLCVIDWLRSLKREVDEPDLWDAIKEQQFPPNIDGGTTIDNRPFSVAEVKQLKAGVSRIRKYLEAECGDEEDKLKDINRKLDYLCEAAERQGRKDWLHTCIGVLFTLGSALGLNQTQGKMLWTLLKGAVSGVVHQLTQ